MDPLLNTWDSKKTTPMIAEGVDFESEIQLWQWMAVNGAVNLSQAQREGNGNHDSLYEWNVPWTVRGGVHFTIKKYFHWYINGIMMKGLPYYDFTDKKYEYLPNYDRTDMSFQFRAPVKPNRLLTRYDGYFEVNNISDIYDGIRDYYWDGNMRRTPIFLHTMYVECGVRVGFRL
jgi:hypothetical protein